MADERTAPFRSARARSTLADVVERCCHRHYARGILLGVHRHSGGPGMGCRARCLHGDLPGARHPSRLAGAAAAFRPNAAHAGVAGDLDTRRAANSCARRCPAGHAKVQEVCVSCHGETGVSVAPEIPHLAGQSGAAIYKQLHDYRTGSRAHPLMTDLAKALDEAIIRRSSRPIMPVSRSAIRTRLRSPTPAGDRQARRAGRPAAQHSALRVLPSRQAPEDRSRRPVLAEQRAEYIVQQLKLYASGERRNDVYARMRAIAAQLTVAEMDGLAAYYRAGFR